MSKRIKDYDYLFMFVVPCPNVFPFYKEILAISLLLFMSALLDPSMLPHYT